MFNFINYFFMTENRIWSLLHKEIQKKSFQEDPSNNFILFLEKYRKQLIKMDINPYSLIFYSPMNRKFNSNDICSIIKATTNYIQTQNLSFSLNDYHEILGMHSPLMEHHFHWSHVDESILRVLIESGLDFIPSFYNNILILLQGHWSVDVKTKKEWSFIVFYNLIDNVFGEVVLNERNQSYYNSVLNNQESSLC